LNSLAPALAQAPEVVSLYNQHKFDAAIEKSKQILNQYPTDPMSHYYLGLAYAAKNEQELAKEQFNYVLCHAEDPHARELCDRALHNLAALVFHPATQTPSRPPTRPQPTPPHGADGAKQFTSAEEAASRKVALETEARLTEAKLNILKNAQQRCSIIDKELRTDIEHVREQTQAAIDMIPQTIQTAYGRIPNPDYQPRVNYLVMQADREIDRLRTAAERRKKAVSDEADKNAAAWESSMEYIKSEMRHPGKNVQIVPRNTTPYVRNYMTFGGEGDDAPSTPEIVPLRAKAGKIKP
jgi:tetratricopeptide (TPR) repeat protein